MRIEKRYTVHAGNTINELFDMDQLGLGACLLSPIFRKVRLNSFEETAYSERMKAAAERHQALTLACNSTAGPGWQVKPASVQDLSEAALGYAG